MRKLILIMLLGLISISAQAEWVKVYTDKTETHYADPSSLKEMENKILMLDATEMLTKGKPFSVKTQREYDCHGKQTRIITMTAFRGTLGEGEELMNNPEHQEWQAVQKNSALENLFKLACEKR
jgi:hypothetical protein